MVARTNTRQTVVVPVTDLVEMPLLTKEEQQLFRDDLARIETEFARGEGIPYEPGDMLKALREHRKRHQ
jgi:hypothetical protein